MGKSKYTKDEEARVDKQPVDDLTFWKKRLDDALDPKVYGAKHNAVYIVDKATWDKINAESYILLKKYIGQQKFHILDAGCGLGTLSALIPTQCTYIGIDFSDDLLNQARKDYPDKIFIQANILNLPFQDEEFDLVVCRGVLGMIKGNLGEKTCEECIKELKRVGKRVIHLNYSLDKEVWIIK